MGTAIMPNSAAAALLSLRMMGSTNMVQDLKSRILSESLDRPSSAGPEERTSDGGEKVCVCDVPVDILAQCFLHLDSFQDMASASRVCTNWREGMRQALACRDKLSFAGWRADDETVAHLVEGAWSLKELFMWRLTFSLFGLNEDSALGRWGSRITDAGLLRISLAKCFSNLTSISLWGVTAITDEGVVQLVKRAHALEHFNVGGTFITDVAVLAIASHCSRLKVLNLWGCRHVTEVGLLALARGCPKLLSINVWGMSISQSCELRLKELNPKLVLNPSFLSENP